MSSEIDFTYVLPAFEGGHLGPDFLQAADFLVPQTSTNARVGRKEAHLAAIRGDVFLPKKNCGWDIA